MEYGFEKTVFLSKFSEKSVLLTFLKKEESIMIFSNSEPMYLHYFTQEKNFPFFVQDGYHDETHKWHHHADFIELTIVLEGNALHQINHHKTYFVKRGDVFVMADGVSHIFVDAQKLHICNIMFRMEDLMENLSDLRKIPGFHALFIIEPYLSKNHEFQSYLKLKPHEFESVNHMVHLLLQEFYSENPGRKTMIISCFRMLVTYLSRCYELPCDLQEYPASFSIANSVSFMEEHFRENYSVKELAEMSNMSTRHFTRIFAEVYHITPKKYIIQQRLLSACRLLEDDRQTQSITEIALDLGFSNSNYFARLFHNEYGMTPSEYRRQTNST